MAHVFTLEVTDHLVPRWFSEGVSVFEEWSTGPLPGRHIPTHVLQAMSEGLFLPVADLDEGFIRPVYENQVIVSYMQAGLICQFIAQNFGQQALRAMLARFRAGDDTAAALEAALQITPEEFDNRFAAHIETEFGDILNALPDWVTAQEQAIARAEAEDWAGAQAAAEEAVRLNPTYVDAGSAYLYLARAQSEQGDRAAARGTLRRYYELGGYQPDALMQLGHWMRDAGETEQAIDAFESLVLVAPLAADVHAELGDLLVETRPADALRSYQTYAAFEPHDQANLNFRLARAWLGLDDTEKATEHLLYALEIAPRYREAQQLLLEIVR
jgi:tetratricopeptide (TPR) repeat protein